MFFHSDFLCLWLPWVVGRILGCFGVSAQGGFLLRVFGTQNDRIHVSKRGIFQTLRVGFSGVFVCFNPKLRLGFQ